MTPFLGQIIMFASTFAPEGYTFCNGQEITIRSNMALYSLLGTNYGGDGRITFAVPDFRGRFPTHAGTGPDFTERVLGVPFGKETVQLGTANLPTHTHAATVSNGQLDIGGSKGGTTIAGGNYLGDAASTDPFYRTSVGTGFIGGLDVQVTNDQTGGDAPFTIVNPGLPITFLLALDGIFPSRGGDSGVPD